MLDELTPEQRFEKLSNEQDSAESQFFKHLFKLDETIDQYNILVFQSNESTDFIWTYWNEDNCNSEHELNQIYSVCIPTVELISWLYKLTDQLKKRKYKNV
jgi:hypothetical protein